MASPQAAAGFLLYSTTRKNDDGSFRIFDTTSLEGLYDIRAEPGRVTCRLPVTERVQNRNGTLHGGCIATIVDIVGSAALITENKRGGVSLNINTNYLRPVPGGGEALIDAQVRKGAITPAGEVKMTACTGPSFILCYLCFRLVDTSAE